MTLHEIIAQIDIQELFQNINPPRKNKTKVIRKIFYLPYYTKAGTKEYVCHYTDEEVPVSSHPKTVVISDTDNLESLVNHDCNNIKKMIRKDRLSILGDITKICLLTSFPCILFNYTNLKINIPTSDIQNCLLSVGLFNYFIGYINSVYKILGKIDDKLSNIHYLKWFSINKHKDKEMVNNSLAELNISQNKKYEYFKDPCLHEAFNSSKINNIPSFSLSLVALYFVYNNLDKEGPTKADEKSIIAYKRIIERHHGR